MRDHLYLLAPDFTDPALPGRRFYCWHCALIEGVLAGFPDLARRLDVTRLPWPRPGRPSSRASARRTRCCPCWCSPPMPRMPRHRPPGPVRFVDDKDAILRALHARHGFPERIRERDRPRAHAARSSEPRADVVDDVRIGYCTIHRD